MHSPLLRQLLVKRTYLLISAHLAIVALSYELAFRLRFDWILPGDMRVLFWKTVLWVLLVKLVFFQRLGSLHGWWRYVTFADLASLLNVSTLSSVAIACVDYFLIPHFQIPRSVILLDWGATILLVGGLRSACRLAREHVWPTIYVTNGQRPALMVGAGQQGEALARQIHGFPRLNYRIVGFLDENPSHHGSLLGGIPVLGNPSEAVQLAAARKVRDILLPARSITGAQLRSLMDKCRQAQIQLKIIPPLDELLQGAYRLQLRDVDINDLLRRPPVQLDCQAIAEMLDGKCVMVTGAGGSIGSEICRQLLQHHPQSLVLIERTENNLFHIDRELGAMHHEVKIHPCIADIGDEPRMRSLFHRYRPHLVFHCAAHKHVPLMEHNPGEAVKNNVLGTITLANLAVDFEVQQFVMISTDKAVNPTSVMGVTKQLAERYVHAYSELAPTKFVVVRFGNVLASAGSVVPIFQEQIRRGGPVTITHPDMRRFFMTIPEASQLVLQAAAMGKGGEIFVLDMGEPVKIIDLARDLIRLSGLSADDIEIRITGVRPGEKLYEELYFDEERTLTTPHPKLRVAYHRSDSLDDVHAAIAQLEPLLHDLDGKIRARLQEVVPEYRPPEPASAAAESQTAETQVDGQLSFEGV
jgi:FlaA1/EpsC-like NDP-sugar epimerase